MADVGADIVVDEDGYIYVAGGTASQDFPLKNPYDSILQGTGVTGITYSGDFLVASPMQTCSEGYESDFCLDAFVTKINSDGSDFVFSTFLHNDGGNNSDAGYDIAIDNDGAMYIAGKGMKIGGGGMAARSSSWHLMGNLASIKLRSIHHQIPIWFGVSPSTKMAML